MAESTANLSILVKVRDEASQAMSRISNDVSDLGGQFNFAEIKAGALAGALSAVAAITISNAVNAFADSEEKMATFGALVTTLPPKLQAYKDKMLEAADGAIQYGFGNEDAALSLVKLIAKTGSFDAAIKLFKASMGLAKAEHMDLESASNKLLMSMENGGKILGRYNIDFVEHEGMLSKVEKVYKTFNPILEAHKGTIENNKKVFGEYMNEVYKAVGSKFSPAIQIVSDKITGWIEKQGGINNAIAKLDPIITLISGLLTGIFLAAAAAALAAFLALLGPIGLVVAGVMALIGVIAALSAAWYTYGDEIMKKVQSIVNYISQKLDTLMGYIGKVREAISQPFEVVTKITQKVEQQVTNIGNWIGNNLPHFATGGIVTSPTLAMVGEAGPEMILPLNRLAGAGGGSINIYIQGDMYTTTEIAEKFANEIARNIKYQLKL